MMVLYRLVLNINDLLHYTIPNIVHNIHKYTNTHVYTVYPLTYIT